MTFATENLGISSHESCAADLVPSHFPQQFYIIFLLTTLARLGNVHANVQCCAVVSFDKI